MENEFKYTRLRRARRLNEEILDEVALNTGISIGYLSKLEMGYVTSIKKETKRKRLEKYIVELEERAKKDF